MVVVSSSAAGASTEYVYVSGIKPLSVARLNVDTNELVEVDVGDLFKSAWRAYYPRVRLYKVREEPQSVLVYEETGDLLYMIDFDTFTVSSLDKSIIKGSGFINVAKKAINKYFADQNSLFKMTPISGAMFASYRIGIYIY